jgi:hypothetical protein
MGKLHKRSGNRLPIPQKEMCIDDCHPYTSIAFLLDEFLMVEPAGFEPTTKSLKGSCSTN